MKRLLLLLCLLAQIGFSQTNQIDSLKRELVNLQKRPNGYSQDTLRFKTLKALMIALADVSINSSAYYNTLAIKLCEEKNLQEDLIYAYQFAGYLYQAKGDPYQSIQFHYKALQRAEKLEKYDRMVVSYGALAHAYSSLEQYEKAKKLCDQGLMVLQNHPDTLIRLSILNVLGVIYRNQSKLEEALKINKEMYELARSVGDQWYESHGLHAIGLVYKEIGNMTQAMDYHEKALALSRQTGSVELEGNILVNIADLYIRMKKWQLALTYCRMAKKTAIRVKDSSILMEAEEKSYKVFKNINDPAQALNAYENFVFLKDSLSKEKNQQRIETLQAQYDNVQKTNALQKQKAQQQVQQLQIAQMAQRSNGLFLGIIAILLVAALLFWNNRRLQAKNLEIDQQRSLLEIARTQLAEINKNLETRVEERTEELVKANRELIQKNEEIKTALFKGQTIERKRVALELHDNLSSLLSAVNMSIQSINPQHLSEPEQSVYRNVRHLIQNAYSEVRNISHNILPAELEREGLATTLTTLVGQLNQNSPLQFLLTITGLQERLPVEIEFNIYSIVFELINNAIKHAKATSVTISLFRTDLGINVSITDDGVGLGQNHGKRGVGLQNIQTRLESLGGTFNSLLPTEKGTRILIKIPIDTVRFDGNTGMS